MGVSREWPGCRRLVDGVRWRVRTGVPWRDLPLPAPRHGRFAITTRSACSPSLSGAVMIAAATGTRT
nr:MULTISPECIES: transposase [Actinoalloteichus]